MKCCINPQCPNPNNPDNTVYCQSCGVPIPDFLRGRFRMIKLLGQGGFGRTYLAEDRDKLDEKCVVKQFVPMIQGTAGLQKALELFEREARQLQQLGHHPQIPALWAYFSENNQLYLIQQYIEGETLDKILQKQGVWTEPQVKELLISLLPVLEFIHQQKVIHRDLKPDNIMRRGNGEYVLIDFGVAKDLSATVIYTQIGTRVGSDGYASREQMQGGEAYPATDLYSLGATCFYLLTKISPLELWLDDGYSWTTNWQKYVKQNLSPELNKVLDQLLKKDMGDRYSSADQVLQDLQIIRPQPAQKSSTPPPPPSTPQPIPSPQASWQNVALVGTLTGHSNYVESVAFSPDGRTLASGSDDNTIKLWDVQNRRQIATFTGHSSPVLSVAFSPDGRTLASGSYKTIKLWDVQNRREVATLTGHSDYVWSVAFSPDGRTLASGSWDKTIKLWDVSRKRLIATLTRHSGWVRSVAFRPDGWMLASGSFDNTIKLWDVQNRQEIATLTEHSDYVYSVAFRPDGWMLASGSDDNTIKLWDVQNRRQIATLTGHSNPVWSVAFSPDGRTLASGSCDKTIKLWDVQSQRPIPTLTLTGHSDYVYSVVFSPDGRMLASGSWDSTIKLWRAP
ncbi:serine/threonine-protein kinase [Planktothrix agardhii]|uniref:serine/threonine-protein kinase n=1 Tax=Planktothrix agardhii TaxID=1160 RepID=UPI001D0A0520|nr:serine/threonine-protein kinase [Planktothrix agardhii]MCB8788550.1 serine/threonine protein kinase [Planktothrix agardhii 1025]MCF3612483.1 serine/threonine protein kinase [Planktothrix agardhii 1027]MCF3646361.1 serine/threonine protein kinase [Planktothrix agardhii 1026]CAD5948055.1 putative WD repeat-containing protein alr3466 [Planktothrix agardhii]